MKMRKPYSLTKEGLKHKRSKKWEKQRKKFGCDETELWNLDVTIARFVYPRLIMFRKNLYKHPNELTPKEWEQNLDKMIFAFKVYAKGDIPFGETFEEHEELMPKLQEGLELFAKYYMSLWD